jgi:hypothetical protein
MADLEPSDGHLVVLVSSLVVGCHGPIRRVNPREEAAERRHIPRRGRLGHHQDTARTPFGTQSSATMSSCDPRCGHEDENQEHTEASHF